MQNVVFQNFEKMGKAAMDSAQELAGINTRIYEELSTANQTLVSDLLELGNDLLTRSSSAKNVQDVLSSQVRFATACNEKLLAAARRTADVMMDSRTEFQAWMDKGFKVVQDNAPTIVKDEARKAA